MNRLEAGQSCLNVLPVRCRRFANAATVARVLCSARDSAVILEPHPRTAICPGPGHPFHQWNGRAFKSKRTEFQPFGL
jgi:hypothetical protein